MSVAVSATSLCTFGVIRRQLVVEFRLEDSRKQIARAILSKGDRGEVRKRKREEETGVSGTFCLFAVGFGGGGAKDGRNIGAFLFLRRGGRQKRTLAGLKCTRTTSYFPLTCAYADGYPVQPRDSGSAAAGSYRGQFNFNLDRNRELPPRFDGVLSCGSLPPTSRGSRTYARSNFRELPRLRLLRIGPATPVESKSVVLLYRIARGCGGGTV